MVMGGTKILFDRDRRPLMFPVQFASDMRELLFLYLCSGFQAAIMGSLFKKVNMSKSAIWIVSIVVLRIYYW